MWNGIRCVGKYVFDKGLTKKQDLEVETLAGIKKLHLHIKDNRVFKVTVDMGKPLFELNKIPVINYQLIEKGQYNCASVKIDDNIFFCVSMGNPHAVTFVNNFNNIDIAKIGSKVENDSHFPSKTNVEFINIIDKKNIEMRVWERGSGETFACGTGACAAMAIAYIMGFTGANVNVKLLGGTLSVCWKEGNIEMTGEATNVFEGEI